MMTTLAVSDLLLCAPLLLATGCFADPAQVAEGSSGTTGRPTTDTTDTTDGDGGTTTGEAGSTQGGDSGSTSGGRTSGEDTQGGSSTAFFCESEDRVTNALFDVWDKTNTKPDAWSIYVGGAMRVPNGQGAEGLRMSPDAGVRPEWSFGQLLPGPFAEGDVYIVDVRYRRARGAMPGGTINVELDGANFPSANIQVVPSELWQETTVILAFDEQLEEPPADAIALLVSSFDSDQVIDFDFVSVFKDCGP